MINKNIFIHIPKTGGTTLDCAVTGAKWMTAKDPMNYRHIVHETKTSNAGDIFRESNISKYKQFRIYTMLRHPVDKVISEYYFVRDRKEYFDLFKNKPRNLEEYIINKQSQNLTLNFLIGGRMYPEKSVKRSDLERVIALTDELDITVGIFEEYQRSLEYYEQKIGFKFPKQIDVKRVTLNRPSLEEVSDDLKKLILEHNKLDLELYNYYKSKFDQLDLKDKKVNIIKDKYEYVLKYTERFNPLTLYNGNPSFINRNSAYFNSLNVYLHQKIPFTQGRDYVFNWNHNVVSAIGENIDISEFTTLINDMDIQDPLITTEAITNTINKQFKSNAHFAKMILRFDIDKCKIRSIEEKKVSFFKRIFGS